MRRQFTCNNPCDLPCKRNIEKHNELMKQRNRMNWGRVVDLSKDPHPCVFPLILSMYGTALISVPTTNVAVRIANFHVSPGTPIRVERAPQPTDIIWENQE